MTTSVSLLTPIGHGIFALDSGYIRDRFDAVHLIVEAGRGAIVDTGTRHSVPRILAAIAALGLEPGEIDWVVLTHVHLDHAGGAGTLMAALPSARLVVHPRGARHMIDPTRLWQATCDVYGAADAERMYGRIDPVPAARVVEASDGLEIRLAGRLLQSFDSPGHARHHVMVRDEASGWIFAGDTFGISYREFDVDGRAFAFPSSTPVQFEPEVLCSTIDRMLALEPEAILLTHYSAVRDVQRIGDTLKRLTRRYADIGLAHQSAGQARASNIQSDLTALLIAELRAHGVTLPERRLLDLLALDLPLNAEGIVSWLDARSRQ
ncbi:MAG: MBL fold metallo-hydrolase [Betaproteobacteria bacterium]|nr:MBL fold metallo-hydrolase [Betaproteobacteria bacterium]